MSAGKKGDVCLLPLDVIALFDMLQGILPSQGLVKPFRAADRTLAPHIGMSVTCLADLIC